MKKSLGLMILGSSCFVACDRGEPDDRRLEDRRKLETAVDPKAIGQPEIDQAMEGVEGRPDKVVNEEESISVGERSLGLVALVGKIPKGEWESLLDCIHELPPGGISSKAFSVALSRIAKESPREWIRGRSTFISKLTPTQMLVAGYEFGKEFARQDLFVEGIAYYTEGDGAESPEKDTFLSGLLYRLGQENLDTAIPMFESLAFESRHKLVESSPEKFSGSAVGVEFCDNLLQEAVTTKNSQAQGLVGGVYAAHGFSVAQVLEASRGSDGRVAAASVLGYFDRISSIDLNQSLKQLSEVENGALRDSLIISLIPKIQDYDPETARLWIDQIENMEKRNIVLKQIE
jgi:hypothetical protein